MKRIKLVGYKTYLNKSGSTTAEVHFVTDIPMTCQQGFMCGGTTVKKEFMRYDGNTPLKIGSTYEPIYDIYEFNGQNVARLIGLTLVK